MERNPTAMQFSSVMFECLRLLDWKGKTVENISSLLYLRVETVIYRTLPAMNAYA
jgi:hypothetical protein